MIKIEKIGMSDPDYRLNQYERETIISFNESPEQAEIYTHNPALIRKLDALYESGEYDMQFRGAEDINGVQNRSYAVPKKWVKVSPPRKVSEEQRQKAREMMLRMRSDAQ